MLALRPGADLAGGRLPRGQRPAPRLVPQLAARRPRHARPARRTRGLTHGFVVDERRPQDVEVARQHRSSRRTSSRRAAPRSSGCGSAMVDYREEMRARQGDPRARRRGVPQDPQHAALPARRTSTTSTRRRIVVPLEPHAGGRSLRARALRATSAATVLRGLRRATTSRRSSRRSNQFATVDLCAFYADVSKDRLYTFARGVARSGARRRRRCTVIADGLARLLAPILPMTADELWRHLPGRARRVGAPRAISRRTSTRWLDDALVERWERLHRRCATQVNRGARGAAAGQDDRHRARGAGHAHAPAGRRGAAAASTRRAADALHRLGGRAAERAADGAASSRVEVTRGGRREMRALLALRRRRSRPTRGREGLCERCVDAVGDDARAGRPPDAGWRRSASRRGAALPDRDRRAAARASARARHDGVVVALDQLTKAIVRQTLPLYESRASSRDSSTSPTCTTPAPRSVC